MNKRNRTIFTSVIAVVALACACPATGLPGGDQPPATFAPLSTIPAVATIFVDIPQNALFSDDFSSDNGEFEVYDGDTGSAGYKDGIYFVRSEGAPWEWGKSLSAEFSDASIEVDITTAEGPANDNAGLGIVCRLVEDSNGDIDGYLLAISADGYYYIGNIDAGDITEIIDWTSSSAINLGGATNRVKATCSGNELTLEVNGEVLDSTTTPAGGPTSGAIGFMVTSYESQNGEPIAEGHFDNLVVSTP